jgi:DHA3 family macrolide efflux protein-like MFS transporter
MRLLAPLRDTPVLLLWGGLSLSAVGDQLYAVALTWIAVGVFGAGAGYLSALGAATVLLIALLSGQWADGREPRAAMIGADLVRGLALLAVVADWTLRGRASAAGLVAITIVLAAGQAIFRPALQALLPALVRDAGRLPAANALLDSTDRVARLLGPGLVAGFAAFLPARHFLSLDAASFGLSATALFLIGRSRALPRPRPIQSPGKVIASILRGFRAVAPHKVLRLEMQVSGAINGAWYAVMFLGLPLALARLGSGGAGLRAYGLVISAYGCTNLLATLVIGSRPMPANPGRTVFVGNLVVGTGLMLIALIAALPLAHEMAVPCLAGAAALGAIGGPMHDIPTAVLRQTELPAGDVPAAMRASLVVGNGGMLAAMLVAPRLYASASPSLVMAGCAALILGIGVAGLVRFAAPGGALRSLP